MVFDYQRVNTLVTLSNLWHDIAPKLGTPPKQDINVSHAEFRQIPANIELHLSLDYHKLR